MVQQNRPFSLGETHFLRGHGLDPNKHGTAAYRPLGARFVSCCLIHIKFDISYYHIYIYDIIHYIYNLVYIYSMVYMIWYDMIWYNMIWYDMIYIYIPKIRRKIVFFLTLFWAIERSLSLGARTFGLAKPSVDSGKSEGFWTIRCSHGSLDGPLK